MAASGDIAAASPMQQPFWNELSTSKRILLCGCGGGYDFFSALPVFLALKRAGVEVFLGNLTFSTGFDSMVDTREVTECCWCVTAESKRSGTVWTPELEAYWPEMHLARFLKEEFGEDIPVYMFKRTGVQPLRVAYQAVLAETGADTVVVVDGGTDSLMFGDEEGLGTPLEDMMTIGAVHGLSKDIKKFLVCLGMGVDCFHGVSHSLFLENVATLCKDGGFLGTWSLLPSMPEAEVTTRAFEQCKPINSIVTSSVLSAVAGEFGNFHHPATRMRTERSTLYISPLMSLYWSFRLDAVAKRIQYLKKLEETTDAQAVRAAIHKFRQKTCEKHGEYIGKRPAIPIPY